MDRFPFYEMKVVWTILNTFIQVNYCNNFDTIYWYIVKKPCTKVPKKINLDQIAVFRQSFINLVQFYLVASYLDINFF